MTMRCPKRVPDSFRKLLRRAGCLALFAAALLGVGAAIAAAQQAERPRNVIIMFGDGAAAAQWELGRSSSRLLRGEPFAVTDIVFRQGTVGLLTTHPLDALVTDSAAAGSAMSTGFKVNNGAISTSPDGRPLRTLMEAAKASGKRIGLVTTATVYDATPAAFSVQAKSRRDYQTIVNRYLALEPDVLLGGGADHFLPAGKRGGRRRDGKDMIAAFIAKGYEVARDTKALKAARGPRLLGLFAVEDMDFEIDRAPDRQPSTAEMAEAALRVLSQNSPNGFVLLVENENLDSAGHRNDLAALIRDLWAFDRAVQVALEFQRRAPGETLVIVTGDHETGGLSATYALRDLKSLSWGNIFYAGREQLAMVGRITISLDAAAVRLGSMLSAEALDRLLAQHFPGFRLDPDLREAILRQQPLERNFAYVTQSALARMVSRQTGFYWGTSGHTAAPVLVGAIGPGAELFRGYQDNTEFGKILHRLIEPR